MTRRFSKGWRWRGPEDLGCDWNGWTCFLMVNLSDDDLVVPRLRAGDDLPPVPLMLGGFERMAAFGGTGHEVLDALAAGGVYALLVPEGCTHFSLAAEGCAVAYEPDLACGEVPALVPEPTTLSLLFVAGVTRIRRKR